MVFSNSVSRQDIQPLILNSKQFETVKEYTRTWELYLCKIESLQGPKEHWQYKQRSPIHYMKDIAKFSTSQCHVIL